MSFKTESSPLIKRALLVKVCIVHWQRGFVTWALGSMSSCSRCFCPRQSATSFTCSQVTPPAASGPKFQEGHGEPNHNTSLGHRHISTLGSGKQLSVFTQVLYHYCSSVINITLFVLLLFWGGGLYYRVIVHLKQSINKTNAANKIILHYQLWGTSVLLLIFYRLKWYYISIDTQNNWQSNT